MCPDFDRIFAWGMGEGEGIEGIQGGSLVHSLPETLPGTCQHMPGLGVRGCLESRQRRNQGPTEVRGLMEGASWERYRVRGIIGEVSREISWKRCDGGGDIERIKNRHTHT